jgi:hypothetical protein
LWIGTVLNLILFLVGLVFTFGAMATAGMSAQSMPFKLMILALCAAVPIISIVGVSKAWNLYGKGRNGVSVSWILAPVIYATLGSMALFLTR